MTKNEKIVAFGEIMLRLTPPDYTTIAQAKNFIACHGGGEANVLASLSHLGHHTSYLSKLPNNQLGDMAIKHLKGHGVDTEFIVKGAESSNIGMYFVETGFGGRPSKVLYNRKHSSITTIKTSEIDLDEIFSGATWFHLSGITLALGDNVRAVAMACLEYCKEHNITVSFDFNYRSKLWNSISEAKPYFQQVIPYVNILFANEFDMQQILEIHTEEDGSDIEKTRVSLAKTLFETTDIHYIFGTNRVVHTATDNSMSSYCICKNLDYKTEAPIRFPIYDRVGAGDAFAAGVIHALIKDYEHPEYALKFGLSTAVLAHTLYGDVATVSESDVEAFIQTNGNAAIQR
ncbi:MAG: sugar kinase [Clostridiales bacterium]|nr:sugar kinase [Clostridiales bacterium]